MPWTDSFTNEAGSFASFIAQVQKSYVPEQDLDGRKFDKALNRLRARLEDTAAARARLAAKDLDLSRRDDEQRVLAVLKNIDIIRLVVLRALQAVEYRRHALWNFKQIVATLYDIDAWSRRLFHEVDDAIASAPPASDMLMSYFRSFGDGTRTFPLTIEGHSRYAMARHSIRVSNEIDLREMRRFSHYFYRAAPALVAAADEAGMRAPMQNYVTAFQLPRSPIGMSYLELGIAAQDIRLALERRRGAFSLQGKARMDQFLAKHDAVVSQSPTWQRLAALAARPQASFDATVQLVRLAEQVMAEIANLSSIQFSSNIEMYLGFRLRAAQKLPQSFPHGPENVPAGVMVMHDFVFAIRDVLMFMAKTIVQNQDAPRDPKSLPSADLPSRSGVGAGIAFFRLIEEAARELAGASDEYFGWLKPFYAELDDLPAKLSGELLAFNPARRR
jgi:hypothetical protein